MWIALKTLFSSMSARLIEILAIVAAALGALFMARRQGEQAAKAESNEEKLNTIQKAHEVENEVRALPDGGAAKRLHDEWHR